LPEPPGVPATPPVARIHPEEAALLDDDPGPAADVVRGEIVELRDERHHVAVQVRIHVRYDH